MADKKKPKQQKQKKEKPEKKPQMRSSAPRRFGAWCFVIFMILMVLFGVYKIISAPTEKSVEDAMRSGVEELDKDSLARTKAVSFAERYAIAYFGHTQGDSYTEKMSAFYAEGITAPTPANESKVGYVGTAAVDIDGSKVNVDVICQVAYATEGDKFDLAQFVTLRVPIEIDSKGNCAVVSMPIYVGNTNNPTNVKSVMNTVNGDGDLKDANAINDTIESFFAAYYKGEPSELNYYITKNYGAPATVGMNITVESVDTQITKSGDKWIAECNVRIDNEGINQDQHCFLEIVKGAEDRYYINKLYTM